MFLVAFFECSQFRDRFAIADMTHWPKRNETKNCFGHWKTGAFTITQYLIRSLCLLQRLKIVVTIS